MPLIRCVFLISLLLCAPCALAQQPVVSYHQLIPSLADQDPTPLLRVYPDGRTVVHVPSYMKNAGTVETWLDDAEMQQLLQDLEQSGVGDFDSEQTRAQIRRQTRDPGRRGPLLTSADGVVTTMDLALPGKVASSARPGATAGGRKRLRWSNLQQDARRFQLPGLRAAAAAERRLQRLIDQVLPQR